MNKWCVVIKMKIEGFFGKWLFFTIAVGFWSQWLFLKIYSGQGFKVKIDCFLKVEVMLFQDFGHFFMILVRLFNDLGTFLKMWVIFSYHGETSTINTNFDGGRFLVDVHILSKIKIMVTLIYFFDPFLIFSTIPSTHFTKNQNQNHGNKINPSLFT